VPNLINTEKPNKFSFVQTNRVKNSSQAKRQIVSLTKVKKEG
jgi:hypothetical protein